MKKCLLGKFQKDLEACQDRGLDGGTDRSADLEVNNELGWFIVTHGSLCLALSLAFLYFKMNCSRCRNFRGL